MFTFAVFEIDYCIFYLITIFLVALLPTCTMYTPFGSTRSYVLSALSIFAFITGCPPAMFYTLSTRNTQIRAVKGNNNLI